MLAKRFFYVCAGVLCLALAYHFGATNATAQGGTIEVASIDYLYGNIPSVVIGRTMYRTYGPGGTSVPSPAEPIPGTSRIIAINGAVGSSPAAMLENGEVYEWDGTPRAWVLKVNMLGGTTPVQQSTFGNIKVRYR